MSTQVPSDMRDAVLRSVLGLRSADAQALHAIREALDVPGLTDADRVRCVRGCRRWGATFNGHLAELAAYPLRVDGSAALRGVRVSRTLTVPKRTVPRARRLLDLLRRDDAPGVLVEGVTPVPVPEGSPLIRG